MGQLYQIANVEDTQGSIQNRDGRRVGWRGRMGRRSAGPPGAPSGPPASAAPRGATTILDAADTQALQEFLVEHGQALVPLVELIEGAQLAVDEFMAVLGRASLEAVLELSARGVAGPKHQGKEGGEVRRHGKQRGTVFVIALLMGKSNGADAE